MGSSLAMARPSKPAKRSARHAWVPDAVERATKLLQRGAVDEAAAAYRQVLAAEPDHVDALHFLGVAEHQRGRSGEAVELMARAAALAPDYPDVQVNLARVFKRLGRLEEAEASVRRALALRPHDPVASTHLGTLLLGRGQREEAVAAFETATVQAPQHADAWFGLGEALEGLGRFDDAIAAVQQAHALRPGTETSFRHLGAMLYARQRVAEAAEVYRAWLTHDPGCSEAQHLLVACSGEAAPERAPDAFVRGLFDRFASSFDDSLARLDYRAPVLVIEATREVAGEPRGTLDVLDAGCGTGLCGADLRPYARRLTGVDLSGGMLDRARAKGEYDALVEAELTEFLGRSPAAYDLIVSADTLVYFGALEALVAALAGALRPGGAFVFTAERSTDAEAPAGHKLHPHGRYSHTEGYVRRVLGGSGFGAVTARPVDLRREAGRWVGGWLVTARL
jgi:predicted TPR repeat methyltransferase